MATCLVLNDAAVHELLIGLSKDETLILLDRVATALKDFSTSDERKYQPDPAVINRPDGRRNLFRCFTSSTGVGVKIIVDPSKALSDHKFASDAEKNKATGLHGLLALCDENGMPTGFVNAEELTGYRTSMSAMILYVQRQDTANIVVFGAGKQALWHLRLALILRGNEIKRITIINRSVDRSQSLITQLKSENDSRWKVSVEIECVQSDDSAKIESALGRADVVFCTTPSHQALFPSQWVTERVHGCYVSAIGSWQPEMLELPPDMLKIALGRSNSDGMVIVDNRDECFHSAGEIIQSGLESDEVAEIGHILHDLATDSDSQALSARLRSGFVIYKSVGVSLTDLATGQALLVMANKKSQGMAIPDF